MNARAVSRGSALAVAIAVVGSLAVPAAFAAPQQGLVKAPAKSAAKAAVKKAKPEDFNGDGYRDLVVSAPKATVNGKAKAGYAAVLYGAKSGSPTAKKQIVHQDAAGIADVAEAGDNFGASVATGDFDGDGYTDLAVGAPNEDVGTMADAGSVTVVWGGPKGLKGSAVAGAADLAEEDRFGGHLVAGDFDGDGKTDLVGAEEHADLRQLSGPFTRDGAPAGFLLVPDGQADTIAWMSDLAAGDFDGDGRTDVVRSYNTTDEYERGYITDYRLGTKHGLGPLKGLGNDRFTGDVVAAGDVNGDGVDDIVTGRVQHSRDYDGDIPTAKGGMITWIPGKKGKGPIPARARAFNQDSPGVPGVAESYIIPKGDDAFGAGLSIGEVNGDTYADIAIGVPGEDLDGVDNAGSVVVLRGTKDGPTGKGSKGFSQNSTGVPGTAEEGDAFGLANKIIDLDGDGKGELIAAAPGENKDSGAVWVFRSAKNGTGPAAKGSVGFAAGSLGTTAARGHLGGAFSD